MRFYAFPVSGPYPDAFYAELRNQGVDVIEGEFTFAGLSKIARGDVIHLHWPSYLYSSGLTRFAILRSIVRFVGLLLYVRARGARLIWTAHNLYPHEPTPVPHADVMVRKLLVAFADKVLVHGAAACAVLVREFPATQSKAVLITHGHWVAKYPGEVTRAAARTSFEISQDAYVFLFFGMCRPYKNLQLLIETFARMPENCRLIIAGKFQSSAYRNEIVRLVETKGTGRIRLMADHIPDQDVQRYFAAADSAVLPYRDTLTSGTAVLAMSLGVPVVAPNKGFLTDLVGPQCGELYSLDDAEGLFSAMNRILNRRFSADDIIASVKKHRWEDAAEATVSALQAQ